MNKGRRKLAHPQPGIVAISCRQTVCRGTGGASKSKTPLSGQRSSSDQKNDAHFKGRYYPPRRLPLKKTEISHTPATTATSALSNPAPRQDLQRATTAAGDYHLSLLLASLFGQPAAPRKGIHASATR